MSEFVVGQRWVVDAEPELGLGVVVGVDTRSVTMMFPLADCERMYAKQQAPLTRIVFEVGDEIHTMTGKQAKVVVVEERSGLKMYKVEGDAIIPEIALSSEIKTQQPLLRLQTGQLDAAKWFAFRRELDLSMARVWQSQLCGLLGVRANLIPHQLYVAHTACQREQVRVLLADEVGLGKTLEAGMILSRLLKFERVQRVLILVPEPLQIQWLVELIRRFNIKPELYMGNKHDFSMGQIHLVPHSVMDTSTPLGDHLDDFDLVIVDEAHHITPNTSSFDVLRTLAEKSPHIIILSATPEQLGLEGHFARLQLLDPAKFSSLQAFIEQEQQYATLNQLIKALPETRDQLISSYQLDADLDDQVLINRLLDCHGIGRVMFRNTRAAVQGFPERKFMWRQIPEDTWEAKFEWLVEFLNFHWTKKVLVFCRSVDRVRECEAYLWEKHAIHITLFHEEMDLIERDSAAAYFADEEDGCQALLCSEIASEGRNFQFCHHLVCLDWPENPDVLEQRIGRLDRIGQSRTVMIHMPYFEGGRDHFKLKWFHDVLNCVRRQSPAAGLVHQEFKNLLKYPDDNEEVFAQAKLRLAELEQKILEGRDALLEMNSCRQPMASQYVAQIAEFERVTPLDLVETASELFHFHFEELQYDIYFLSPTDTMLIPSMPGIPPEGVEVTFNREMANAREDVMFMTWDSPFVLGLWDMLRQSDLGSASVALLPSKQLPAGKCLLEGCFNVVIQSPKATECLPFLTELSVRVILLEDGNKDLSDALPEALLEQSLAFVDKKVAGQIVLSRKHKMSQWYAQVEALAQQKSLKVIDEAVKRVDAFFDVEIKRLEYLLQLNPNVTEHDLEALKVKSSALKHALNAQTRLQLSAIRLVVTSS